MKICNISSCGAHLTEVQRLMSAYAQLKYFYVINKEIAPQWEHDDAPLPEPKLISMVRDVLDQWAKGARA